MDSCRERQGQEDGYLLWELRVVQSGLKDAGWKDWGRDKDMRHTNYKEEQVFIAVHIEGKGQCGGNEKH